MGKTTLYHPVSLHVIRGAAEYCGWQFNKISQITSDREDMTAVYAAEINGMPKGAHLWSYAKLRECLGNCFMDDIHVDNLWRTKSGQWMALIWVDLKKRLPDHQDGSNRLRQTGG